MGKKAKLKEATDSPSPFKVRLVILLEYPVRFYPTRHYSRSKEKIRLKQILWLTSGMGLIQFAQYHLLLVNEKVY